MEFSESALKSARVQWTPPDSSELQWSPMDSGRVYWSPMDSGGFESSSRVCWSPPDKVWSDSGDSNGICQNLLDSGRLHRTQHGLDMPIWPLSHQQIPKVESTGVRQNMTDSAGVWRDRWGSVQSSEDLGMLPEVTQESITAPPLHDLHCFNGHAVEEVEQGGANPNAMTLERL
jgi:hypothetical protein